MKILGYIMMILLVSVVLISWGGILTDFEQNYVDTNISETSSMNSSFTEDYSDRATEINETFSPLIEDIDDLGSQDGWLDILGDGANVISILVVTMPKAVLTLTFSAISDMVDVLQLIGIPPALVLIAIVGLSLFGLFKLIGYIATRGASEQ